MTDPWQEFYDWMESREQLRLDGLRTRVLSFSSAHGAPYGHPTGDHTVHEAIIIRGNEGSFTVNAVSGVRETDDILNTTRPYPEIVCADVDEFRKWLKDHNLPTSAESVDVLLIGCWDNEGNYESADHGAREDYLRGLGIRFPAKDGA